VFNVEDVIGMFRTIIVIACEENTEKREQNENKSSSTTQIKLSVQTRQRESRIKIITKYSIKTVTKHEQKVYFSSTSRFSLLSSPTKSVCVCVCVYVCVCVCVFASV
jgi:hypothetical protein